MIELAEIVTSCGAKLLAALCTVAAFVKAIEPVPPAFCVSAADFTCSFKTCRVENTFLVASDVKSATASI